MLKFLIEHFKYFLGNFVKYFFESNIMRIGGKDNGQRQQPFFPALSDSYITFLVNAFIYAEQSETV